MFTLFLFILTGLVLSTNDICLNTQLTVLVNILWYVNFGAAKVVKSGFMFKCYFEVCQTFVEPLLKYMTIGAFTTLDGRRF